MYKNESFTISFSLLLMIVTSILRRLVENGWMGPEWAAMNKVLCHSSELYIHSFTRRLPIRLKNAIEFIENADKQYLLQTYRKKKYLKVPFWPIIGKLKIFLTIRKAQYVCQKHCSGRRLTRLELEARLGTTLLIFG